MENNEKELEERELKERELMNENENREFYVYVHIRKDNNTVFYVGKGTKNRAYDLDRSNFHNGVCKKYGCRVEIIKDGLTESQAFRLESKMIKYYVLTLGYGAPIEGYDNYDHNLPYLTNFTWGGEGVSGYKHSEEAKRKIGESSKGENNPMFGKNAYANKTPEEMEEIGKKKSKALKGKKHSEETKLKMSEKAKGRQFSEEHRLNLSKSHKGKKASEETKRKMSKAQSKKVICITTGKKFDSIKEAATHYNVLYPQYISKCCRRLCETAGELNGKPLKWKYSEDDDNESKAV